jgi:polar amino acid transport system substrate-binding protein
MKDSMLSRLGGVAIAAMLVVSVSACTNTEAPAEETSETASAESNLGAGGLELARAVKPDAAVEALVPQELKDKGIMQLVTDPTYAPIDFVNDKGEIVGLEPDMALAVGNKMGLEIEINKGDFNGILAGIQSDRYDASWAAFSITTERTDIVNMISYMAGGTAVMVKTGTEKDYQDVLDLCGLTIAVQTGTTQALNVMPQFEAECLAAGKDPITPLVLPQQDSANQSVASGRAQAMIADNALVAYYAQIQPDAFAAVPTILVEPSLAGVVTNKKNVELAEAFQAAIQSLMDDGTYGKILSAWSLDSAAIKTSEINPTVG